MADGFDAAAVLDDGVLGRRDDLTRGQDPLLPPSGPRVHDGLGGVLVFRDENQACASWGIPLDRS